jgi:hypothetical protein
MTYWKVPAQIDISDKKNRLVLSIAIKVVKVLATLLYWLAKTQLSHKIKDGIRPICIHRTPSFTTL